MGLPCVISLERGSATALRNKIKVGDYLVGIKNIDSHDFERTGTCSMHVSSHVQHLLLVSDSLTAVDTCSSVTFRPPPSQGRQAPTHTAR